MFNRMSQVRKGWLLAATVIALLSAGLAGSTVLAASNSVNSADGGLEHWTGHQPESQDREHADAVMARVAEIVGVEQAALEAAFRTARDEQAEIRFATRIDELVADETLTGEQGDAAKGWFEDRPKESGPTAIILAVMADTDRVEKLLVRLVKAKVVTQQEADALADWHGDRPAFLPEPSRRHR